MSGSSSELSVGGGCDDADGGAQVEQKRTDVAQQSQSAGTSPSVVPWRTYSVAESNVGRCGFVSCSSS